MRDTTLGRHDALMEAADSLPPLPATTVQLAVAMGDPGTEPEDISAIVMQDAVSSARLLREANSASAGSRSAVDTVAKAVIRLGSARVLAVCLSAHIGHQMSRAFPAYGLDADSLNVHSVHASWAAELCVRMSPRHPGSNSIAAALVHDLGKMVIEPGLNADLAAQLLAADPSVVNMERELVDADHAEVGAYVLEIWQLPKSIVEAVRYHHEPGDNESAQVVAVADWLAKVFDGAADASNPESEIEGSLMSLGLDTEVAEILDGMSRLVDQRT